jgi:hypothetical protein
MRTRAAMNYGPYSPFRDAYWSLAKGEQSSEVIERNGRHEETRTPDLYRVKVAL